MNSQADRDIERAIVFFRLGDEARYRRICQMDAQVGGCPSPGADGKPMLSQSGFGIFGGENAAGYIRAGVFFVIDRDRQAFRSTCLPLRGTTSLTGPYFDAPRLAPAPRRFR